MKNKVSVIGAGHVGATAAQYIAEAELADVVLLDIIEGIPHGKGLDLMEAGPVRGFSSHIKGTNSYEDTAGSDVVIVTGGLARRPGMSRDDLLSKNAQIIKSITENAARYSPESIIIMVTNPLDVMAYVALKASGFVPNRVIGMAGVLDTARFRAFMAMELGVSVQDTQALVLGGHGDSMVPLARFCAVSGIPVTELMPEEKINAIIERTRKAGGEIVAYLKTGSAYYSPGASAAELADAVLKDKKRVLPCAVYLNGEYGVKDVYMGVPVVLGKAGAEKVIEVSLTENEKREFLKSASAVRRNIKKAEYLL